MDSCLSVRALSDVAGVSEAKAPAFCARGSTFRCVATDAVAEGLAAGTESLFTLGCTSGSTRAFFRPTTGMPYLVKYALYYYPAQQLFDIHSDTVVCQEIEYLALPRTIVGYRLIGKVGVGRLILIGQRAGQDPKCEN